MTTSIESMHASMVAYIKARVKDPRIQADLLQQLDRDLSLTKRLYAIEIDGAETRGRAVAVQELDRRTA